jgi:hypothetical protein
LLKFFYREAFMESEDIRKKRVSDLVASPLSSAKEKPKKLKGEEEVVDGTPIRDDPDIGEGKHAEQAGQLTGSNKSEIKNEYLTSGFRSSRGAWDLESALYRVSRIGASTEDQGSQENFSSLLSADGDDPTWIKYRVGHAGDASMLGACYRRMMGEINSLLKVSSSLELWLAEGLGDEGSPPSLFALLAETFSEVSPVRLEAAALLTQMWCEGKRLIRVEWLYARDDRIARSMWLRLASLGILSSCELLVSDAVSSGTLHKDFDASGADAQGEEKNSKLL